MFDDPDRTDSTGKSRNEVLELFPWDATGESSVTAEEILCSPQ